MNTMKTTAFRTGWLLIVACLALCMPQTASAQDFLKKYKSVTVKNLPEFIEAWAEWSAPLAEQAKADLNNTLTRKVWADLTKESKYLREYNAEGRYTVLPLDVTVRFHTQELGKRRPNDSGFNDDVTAKCPLVPYVETDKPILYLNTDIAKRLDDFIRKGEGREREEMVKAYFNAIRDTGGYHYCTLPYIGSFDTFNDSNTVVYLRKGWGEGSWINYEQTWKQGKTLGEYIR